MSTKPTGTNCSSWRAIAWKELREVLPWAGGAMLITAGTLGFVVYTQRDGIPMTDDGFTGMFILANLVGALLIGIPQWARDLTANGWALLVHRPATRNAWLWSKVGVGLSVYLVSQAVPLLVSAAYCTLPGATQGPFYAVFLLPPTVDLSIGAMAYVAAGLIGARDARWLGSRLFWIPGVMWMALMSHATETLWGTLLWNTLAIAVLLLALQRQWSTRQRTPLGWLGQGLTGAAMAVALLVLGGLAFRAVMIPLQSQQDRILTNITVTPDGQPVYVTTRWNPRTQTRIGATDLEGNPIELLASNQVNQAWLHVDSNRWPDRWRNMRRFVQELHGDRDGAWYYETARGLYVMYDKDTYLPTLAFGANGFGPVNQAEPLPRAPRSLALAPTQIVRNGRLEQTDLSLRGVKVLVKDLPPGDEVRAAASIWSNSTPELPKETRTLVLVGDRLIVTRVPPDQVVPGDTIYGQPERVFEADLPAALRLGESGTLVAYQLPAGGWVLQPMTWWNHGPMPMVKFDATGQIVEQWDVPHPANANSSIGFDAVAVALMPPGFVTTVRLLSDGPRPAEPDPALLWGMVASGVLGLVSAAGCFGLQRRREGRVTRSVWGWAALGLLLGVVAFPLRAVMLAKRYPGIKATPSPRLVDREPGAAAASVAV